MKALALVRTVLNSWRWWVGSQGEAMAPSLLQQPGEWMCHLLFSFQGWHRIQEEKWERRGKWRKEFVPVPELARERC